jgi:hypothetical protein
MKSAFEEVLRRFDSFDAKWEAKFAGSETTNQERAAETDRRLIALENASATVASAPACVSAMEAFCSAQSEAMVVADD